MPHVCKDCQYLVFSEDMLDELREREPDELKNIKRVVEKFVVEHDLIVSNADSMLLYSSHPLYYANLLANTLAESLEYHVSLRTLVPYREFMVTCDLRFNIFITILERFSTMSIEQYVKDNSTEKPTMMLPEIELIGIYNILYNIEFKAKWDNAVVVENDLSAQLFAELHNNTHIARGGGANMITITEANLSTLMKWMTNLTNIVWVNKDKLMCISTNLKQTQKELDAMFSNVSGKCTDYKISPDFRETKYTFYASIKNRQVPILDVFNCAEYELIPAIGDLAHPIVQLKFLLVDLFTVTIKYKLNHIDEDKMKKIRYAILSKMRGIRQEAIDKHDTLQDVPFDSFVGLYYPKEIAVKERFLGETNFPIYDPREFKAKNDAYREISLN